MSIKMFLFLITLVLIRLVGAPHSEAIKVIRELNRAFQTELNVFIDFKDFGGLNILHSLDPPRILLNSSSGALILVQLTDSGLDPKVANLLPHLLDKLHELHIVFLSMEEPVFSKRDLYTYCFKEGFVNVILICGKDLYSYLPYPTIQPNKLVNISEYLNRGRIIRNFKGHPVRTLRTTLAPRDFEYFNDKNELVRAGYLFMAVKEFTYRYNATLESVPLPDVSEYESYAVIMNMLVTKKIDVVCYFKDFRWDVSYTAPLSIIPEYFMVPHARPISSYLYYSRPFSWTLWLVVISTVLYGTLMLYLTSGGARNEIGSAYCIASAISCTIATKISELLVGEI